MTQQDWINVGVFRLPMGAPEDVSGLKILLETGQVQADSIILKLLGSMAGFPRAFYVYNQHN